VPDQCLLQSVQLVALLVGLPSGVPRALFAICVGGLSRANDLMSQRPVIAAAATGVCWRVCRAIVIGRRRVGASKSEHDARQPDDCCRSEHVDFVRVPVIAARTQTRVIDATPAPPHVPALSTSSAAPRIEVSAAPVRSRRARARAVS
jgi:hypothetical protein